MLVRASSRASDGVGPKQLCVKDGTNEFRHNQIGYRNGNRQLVGCHGGFLLRHFHPQRALQVAYGKLTYHRHRVGHIVCRAAKS